MKKLLPVFFCLFLSSLFLTKVLGSDLAGVKPGRFRVVLDPGHGGRDSATKAEGFYEKDVVFNIALETKKQLEAKGFEVILTRTDDTFIPLTDRPKIKGDAFISLHANTVPERIGPSVRSMIKGIEIFTESTMSDTKVLEESKLLASHLWNSLNDVEGMNVRGNVKQKPLAVLRNNESPAVLIELGYLTNKEDLAFLTDRYCYQRIADALCSAIEEYRKDKR